MLAQVGQSLVCANRHTYDIARQGYVNLLRKKPENLYENKALFAARRDVYAAGFFDPVIEAVNAALPAGRVLDAGCGEGTLLARLLSVGRTGIGLDIARPAVQLAAGTYKDCAWCVGDLCDIPLADASVDAIVNMLTPANYGEFVRVLKPAGTLVKIVPDAEHLREIRAVTGAAPYAHTPMEAQAVLERHFHLRETKRVTYTVPCGETLAAQVFTMTPLTAHAQSVDPARLPGRITVDVQLLIAQGPAGI